MDAYRPLWNVRERAVRQSSSQEPAASARRTLRNAILLMIPAVLALAVYGWWVLGANSLSVNGYIALTLGVLVTLALAVGLMTLVFYSNRYGYDDRIGSAPEEGSEQP